MNISNISYAALLGAAYDERRRRFILRGIESFPPEQRAALQHLTEWRRKTGRRMLEMDDVAAMTSDERQHTRNALEAAHTLRRQFEDENPVPPDAPEYRTPF